MRQGDQIQTSFVTSIYFNSPPLLQNKKKLYKTSYCWSRDTTGPEILCSILIFLEKSLGLVSPPHFTYDFSTKLFRIVYSIILFYIIVSLPVLYEILGSMCITIVCKPGSDLINFKIYLKFLIKLFFYITKNSRHNLKYLENEKSF